MAPVLRLATFSTLTMSICLAARPYTLREHVDRADIIVVGRFLTANQPAAFPVSSTWTSGLF